MENIGAGCTAKGGGGEGRVGNGDNFYLLDINDEDVDSG